MRFHGTFLLLPAIASPAHAFLYEFIDLMSPGWTDATTESHDVIGRMTPRTFINNNGTVAAWGHDSNGNQKAFIATPEVH